MIVDFMNDENTGFCFENNQHTQNIAISIAIVYPIFVQ